MLHPSPASSIVQIWVFTCQEWLYLRDLAPVVKKVDSAIHPINLYPLDSAIILVFPISTGCYLMEDAIQLLNNWGLGHIRKIEMLPILPICLFAHLKRYWWFPVLYYSQQSLGRSGNREIPDHPGLSQQLKTRTKDAKKIPNETTGHPVLEAHKANYRQIYTLCLINIYFSLHVSDYANKIKTQNTERA